MTHYLTRAALDLDAPEHALRPLLDPVDPDAAFDAHHRLIWTLFPDRNGNRDFLWRVDDRGRFLILSARKPQFSRLFRPLETKPFAPALVAGDRLSFMLRVNATRDRRSGPGESVAPGTRRMPTKDRRVDIVMHAMSEQGADASAGPDGRASRRLEIAREAAGVWLAAQGERRGFAVENLEVEDYLVRRLKRRRGNEARFGILDLVGRLSVIDPASFTRALLTGFGRARAYGCGLMLVRRA